MVFCVEVIGSGQHHIVAYKPSYEATAPFCNVQSSIHAFFKDPIDQLFAVRKSAAFLPEKCKNSLHFYLASLYVRSTLHTGPIPLAGVELRVFSFGCLSIQQSCPLY